MRWFYKKIEHHQRDHDRAGIDFKPIVFEVAGGMHPGVIDLVKYCAQIYARRFPDLLPSYITAYCPSFKRYWLLRLSIANLLGTTNAIFNYKKRPYSSDSFFSNIAFNPGEYAQLFKKYVRRPFRR